MRGWWFDGCCFADAMYRHDEAPNFDSFAAAARAGNPDSIVAFNPGLRFQAMTSAEDYTAGETNELDQITHRGRWVEGEGGHLEQFHVWSYLGPTWGKRPLRFSDAEAIAHTRRIVENGGAIMWDVAFGTWPLGRGL